MTLILILVLVALFISGGLLLERERKSCWCIADKLRILGSPSLSYPYTHPSTHSRPSLWHHFSVPQPEDAPVREAWLSHLLCLFTSTASASVLHDHTLICDIKILCRCWNDSKLIEKSKSINRHVIFSCLVSHFLSTDGRTPALPLQRLLI